MYFCTYFGMLEDDVNHLINVYSPDFLLLLNQNYHPMMCYFFFFKEKDHEHFKCLLIVPPGILNTDRLFQQPNFS